MISVFPDLEQLSHAASALIAQYALAAAAERGRFTIALAGGHTPKRTYELLATMPPEDPMPWTDIHVYWGDERYVPADDARSNQRMARERLLDHVPIPPGQVHAIEYAESLEESADRYEQCLREFLGRAPRFDLILLGLGEDGHTASLFPHTPVLTERKRWVAAVHIDDQNLHRVTLTAPLINRARTVLFLVSGPHKASAVQAVRQGPADPDRLPAQLIRPVDGELRWLVDEAAAAHLAGHDYSSGAANRLAGSRRPRARARDGE
jgi:6-phosphogluconolactonase